ncbi:hypothetical protein ABIB75_007389 [Bradyrhizobium sp. GM2.2]|uniref:hypothetical protein n=1 Tax=unclassified Bradyrhizobium TaxID=2631580 RepID=UPI001FF93406|nr:MULTISPECIES: hypothetical protein [unclassified Bradyrhizobium]MCK1332146.1 hypothetical protein [Bradyrhizobium sp. CW9]MCK1452963.1 hypothetical protein [Bradyrhizobium sp. 35]
MGDRRRIRDFVGPSVELPDHLERLIQRWVASDPSGAVLQHIQALALTAAGETFPWMETVFDVDQETISSWIEAGCRSPLTLSSARLITRIGKPLADYASFRIQSASLQRPLVLKQELPGHDLERFKGEGADQAPAYLPMTASAAATARSIEHTDQGRILSALIAAFAYACSVAGHQVEGHLVDCQGLDNLVCEITEAMAAAPFRRKLVISSLGVEAAFELSVRDPEIPFELTHIELRC